MLVSTLYSRTTWKQLAWKIANRCEWSFFPSCAEDNEKDWGQRRKRLRTKKRTANTANSDRARDRLKSEIRFQLLVMWRGRHAQYGAWLFHKLSAEGTESVWTPRTLTFYCGHCRFLQCYLLLRCCVYIQRLKSEMPSVQSFKFLFSFW